jgi:hypothetical protein
MRRGENRTNKNTVTKLALGIMGMLTMSGLLAVPSFANLGDISLSGVNTGSATGGGIVEGCCTATGASTIHVMGTTTFVFSGLSPRSFTKNGADGPNIWAINLSTPTPATVCLDLSVGIPAGIDGPSVECTATSSGNAQYTYILPSTHGGLVTPADTVTLTLTCDPSSSIACSTISLGWGGPVISSSNLIVGIPETNPANPTLRTTLSSTTITAGGSVTDTATLAGGTISPAASGTITFFFTTTNVCPAVSGATQVGGAVTVTGNGAYTSASHTFSTAGTFYYYAVYSGDANNNGAASACEPLVVNPVSTGAPQFPAGMLAVIALALPALILVRRYSGIQGPTF